MASNTNEHCSDESGGSIPFGERGGDVPSARDSPPLRSDSCGSKEWGTRDNSGGDAPPLLPDDPQTFWSAAVDLEDLEPPPKPTSGPTLERLVPSPFPRSGFPLIGFLATVYDHVASFARERHNSPEVSPLETWVEGP